ncbi:hypothetical protein JW710_00750 [Candidatus Dojkabacteria bacterium]|nr:hypothetical protein [Candidatus Dojkabacteria bacterium]
MAKDKKEMIPLIIASVVAVILIVVLVLLGGRPNKQERENIYSSLNECLAKRGGGDAERRDCIIKMDNLLGRSMKYALVRGETVGERLKNAKTLFNRDDYNGIWEAHKLRNRIVHEDVAMASGEFDRAVKYFQLAIRRLLK